MGSKPMGEVEHLVLLAILRLGTGTYGVPIRDEIERRADREQVVHQRHHDDTREVQQEARILDGAEGDDKMVGFDRVSAVLKNGSCSRTSPPWRPLQAAGCRWS